MAWDYDEALEWLFARQRLGVKLGLDKVRDLLQRLGDPQDAFRSVHVAGTNGKGSVTAFVAAALRRAGHRTGAFTSPHLVSFTERITVDGEPIRAAEVAAGLARIRPHVEALDAAGTPPTFFEVNTALALLHFRDAGVAWAVVEAGMGGRLDATNVLRPALTIITNVSLDHAQHLGAHVGAIASEKAGIMKEGVPCVTAADGDALVVLKATSRALHVPMSILGEDYHVLPDAGGLRLVHPGGEARYEVAMAGEHQLHNAALAVAACDALRSRGVGLPVGAVQEALRNVRLQGRLESFIVPAARLAPDAPQPDRLVELLLDGAHNPAGARALRYHLGRRDWSGFHLVAGFMADKEWDAMLADWVPLAAHVWGAPVRSPRGLPPAAMADAVAQWGIPFQACQDVATALAQAVERGAKAVVVAGSLWLVGEARAVLTGMALEEIRGSQ